MKTIKISLIKPDPTQPRQEFNPYDLGLLKSSIASQGIISPLAVEKLKNGKYLLCDGERRLRASIQLGLKEVPVQILEPMTDLERLVKRFHIQEQHKNWSYFDKARAIKFMIDAGELNKQEVTEVLGLSSKVVSDLLTLLSMSKRTQEMVARKRVPYNFLVRTSRLLYHVKDKNLKPKVEEAVMNRIESGMIDKMSDIDDYRRAIEKAGDRIAVKMIKNKTYTPDMAMVESKADDIKIYDSLKGGINWFNSRIDNALAKKSYRLVDRITATSLRKAHTNLGHFVRNIKY